jgi:hypothetical protein
MIYKIIHKDFEINLLDKNLDFTEQNQWFVNGVSINFTLPISIILTKELDQVFNMISHLNSQIESSTFDVKIYKMNTSYDAVLSIEKITGLQIDLSFKYGFDEYPNFSKELSRLPLEDKDVFGLRQDANSLTETYWPESNYKYPAVLVPLDILDNDFGRFDAFEGVINLFEDEQFVENTFNTETNTALNRTVLQPFPYVLHVLQVGFEDAGFTLSGDILADDKLQKLLFGKISEYYINFSGNQQDISITTLDLTAFVDIDTGHESYGLDHNNGEIVINIDWSGVPIPIQNLLLNQGFPGLISEGWYYRSIELNEPGKYILAGNVTLFSEHYLDSDVRIYIGDNLLYSMNNDPFVLPLRKFETISIEFNLFTTTPTNLKIYGVSCFTFEEGALETQSTVTETSIVDLSLTKIASREFGVFVPALNVSNKVKLSETMPDKTFGDLVKAVMAWRNLDITVDINNHEVIMNKITESINLPVSQDLRHTEVRFPTREPNEKKSFLLQFQEKQDDLDYKKLLFSREGAQTEGFQKDENTQEINIGLFPVLNKLVDGLTSTFYEDNHQSVISVFYHDDDSVIGNFSLDPTSLLIPSVFEQDHRDWLRFRLFSQTFKWSNVMSIEKALHLSVRKKSFAYNQNHFIKQLIVRIIDKDFTEVDLETEA